jgi:hypothetical protein
MSDITTRLVQSVYDHALAHYEEGWDMVVETMGEVWIAEIVKGCRSVDGAIKRVSYHTNLWVERQANAGVPEAMRELELGRQDMLRDLSDESEFSLNLPAETDDGVVCGACTSDSRRSGSRSQARHATVAAVRLCAQRREECAAQEQDVNAEYQIELAHERYLENGGRHAEAISADLEDERRREQGAW